MRIVELRVSDLKKITAIEIRPPAGIVEVAGKNAQGKSTLLDSIFTLLGGKTAVDEKPVRDGQERAVIEANLGDYIVRKTINPDRTGTIAIKTKDGKKLMEPQKILDELIGKLSFDPLLFVRQDGKQQLDMLRGFAEDVDFDALDEAEQDAFNRRTDLNREVKSLTAIVSAHKPVAAGDELVDVSELTTRLEKATARNDKIRAVLAKRALEDREADSVTERLTNNEQKAADLRAELVAVDARIGELLAAQADHKAMVDKRQAAPDLEPVEKIMADLRAANEANTGRAAAAGMAAQMKIDRDRLAAAEAKAKAADAEVEGVRAEREEALRSIDLPVAGLTVTADGILFDGQPLSQASFAQQLQLGVALAMKANPTLKVAIIKEASMLDDEAMQALAEMAAKEGFQVWIERVGKGSEDAIVIEAGAVKSAPEGVQLANGKDDSDGDEVDAAQKRAAKRKEKVQAMAKGETAKAGAKVQRSPSELDLGPDSAPAKATAHVATDDDEIDEFE